MVDISTNYLGYKLASPLVASSSPICENLDKIKQLEDAGVGAVVLHSLFEEQIERNWTELDKDLFRGTESYAESLNYIPQLTDYSVGPDRYLEHLRKVKESVSFPVIASLNGCTQGGWIEFAKQMEQAGADGLELNIYYLPIDPQTSSEELERTYVGIVRSVVKSVAIPVSIKLSHFFTSIPNIATKLEETGVRAMVLFNRFYQPDFDLDNLNVVPNLTLSNSNELRLRLRWVAILVDQVRAELAITGGIHTGRDVLKAMMAGAKVAMTTSALLKHGIGYASVILREMQQWMEEHEYVSIRQMNGSMSMTKSPNPKAFGRANYVRMLRSYAQQYLADSAWTFGMEENT